MVTHSDDDGATWSDPLPRLRPARLVLPRDGRARPPRRRQHQAHARTDPHRPLARRHRADDRLVGRRRPRPATAARPGPSLSPEIRLFPHWTELYGASNPHRLSDGRLLWAVMGTRGRDVGWHAGVSVSDAGRRATRAADDHRRRPMAATTATSTSSGSTTGGSWPSSASTRPARACCPTRATRGAPGRRSGRRRSSARTSSSSGSARARSPAPTATRTRALRGVSLSVSHDGGETWTFGGQLYAAGPDALHQPGSVCGYPDVVPLRDGDLAVVLHAYPDRDRRHPAPLAAAPGPDVECVRSPAGRPVRSGPRSPPRGRLELRAERHRDLAARVEAAADHRPAPPAGPAATVRRTPCESGSSHGLVRRGAGP